MISRVKGFLIEVRTELEKCSWPWDPKEKPQDKKRRTTKKQPSKQQNRARKNHPQTKKDTQKQ